MRKAQRGRSASSPSSANKSLFSKISRNRLWAAEGISCHRWLQTLPIIQLLRPVLLAGKAPSHSSSKSQSSSLGIDIIPHDVIRMYAGTYIMLDTVLSSLHVARRKV